MNSYHMSSFKNLLTDALCEKPGSYVIEAIFSQYKSIAELLDVTEQELMQIKAIGPRRARQIISALKLASMLNMPYEDSQVIRSPEDAANLVIPELRYLHKEHFVCVFLNTKNAVIRKETISIGSLNASIVHPREVFRQAIKYASASVIAAHNHPSGDPSPSPEDIEISKRLKKAGEIIGIEFLDHIIVGGSTYASLKEQGLL